MGEYVLEVCATSLMYLLDDLGLIKPSEIDRSQLLLLTWYRHANRSFYHTL